MGASSTQNSQPKPKKPSPKAHKKHTHTNEGRAAQIIKRRQKRQRHTTRKKKYLHNKYQKYFIAAIMARHPTGSEKEEKILNENYC